MVGWQGFEPWTNGLKGQSFYFVSKYVMKLILICAQICAQFGLFFDKSFCIHAPL